MILKEETVDTQSSFLRVRESMKKSEVWVNKVKMNRFVGPGTQK